MTTPNQMSYPQMADLMHHRLSTPPYLCIKNGSDVCIRLSMKEKKEEKTLFVMYQLRT
jgi:hypothetical protein